MELTPQQLCDVEFSEQWRGYNRDQVDDFIERVAAGVATLQDRLRRMTERAVRAEQRASDGTEADGAARRTLVLAQRTADATVAEAKETAARIVAQAQEEARAIMLAAETSVASTGPEPGPRVEIAELEVTRSRLQADVTALEAQLGDRRARIKDLLGELQRRVDEGLEGHIAQWPSLDAGPVELDEAVDDALAELATEPPPPEPPPPAPEVPPEPVVEPALDVSTPAGETAQEREQELALPDVDDDTYFAQLRGALDDDAPLGPRDDEGAGGMLRWREDAATAVAEAPRLYDQEQPQGRRFGLRLRRQRRRG